MGSPDFIFANGERYVKEVREKKFWDIDNPPNIKKTVLADSRTPTPNPIPVGFKTKEVFNPDFIQWLKCFVLKTVTDPESV